MWYIINIMKEIIAVQFEILLLTTPLSGDWTEDCTDSRVR